MPFIQDVRFNGDGTAWVLITIPVASVDRRRRIEAMSPGELDRPDNDARDRYQHSVLELVDLDAGTVLRTIVTPRFSTIILGGEPTIGHYSGDLPSPRLHVVRY